MKEQCRTILRVLLFAVLPNIVFGIGQIQKIDSLSFSLHKVSLLNSKPAGALVPLLTVDTVNHYNYYTIDQKFEDGDKLAFKFLHTCDSGYLYVYTSDKMNNITEERVVDLSKKIKGNKMLNDSSAFTVPLHDLDQIVLWYSTTAIANFSKTLKIMEMSTGDFIFRSNGQLGDKLLKINKDWFFLKNAFGFATKGSYRIPENKVLPIILDLKNN